MCVTNTVHRYSKIRKINWSWFGFPKTSADLSRVSMLTGVAVSNACNDITFGQSAALKPSYNCINMQILLIIISEAVKEHWRCVYKMIDKRPLQIQTISGLKARFTVSTMIETLFFPQFYTIFHMICPGKKWNILTVVHLKSVCLWLISMVYSSISFK